MIWHKETQQTTLDLYNHAPQKHEEMGGLLTENGMKMLAEGVVHLRKIPVSNGVCCTKMGDECCGDGRKNDDRYRKKNQRLQSVSWIILFVFH